MTAIVIPSLGGRHLGPCLEAVSTLDPAPATTVVVISGGATPPVQPEKVHFLTIGFRLGFAAAANLGMRQVSDDCERIALLNDDAVPASGWLAPLRAALDADPALGAVQGTITNADGSSVDGRGIALDQWGLPIQVDRGLLPLPEPETPRHLIAVSATAALYRTEALRAAELETGEFFDTRFGSYHEDFDLGIRMGRLGWRAAWVPGAPVSHHGSATGLQAGWHHPWWLLTNRWRALSGNMTGAAIVASLPRLLRGDLRAVRTLGRHNPRALIAAVAGAAALPWVLARGLGRHTPGSRLSSLPVVTS